MHNGNDERSGRLQATSLLSTPNLISLTRLPLALAFVLVHDTTIRIAIAATAAFTDWLDGWWARTRGQQSTAGALVDPVTDKAFVVAALTGFVASGTLSLPQLLVLLARDIAVALGAFIVLVFHLPVRLRARFPGKLLTNVQIAAIIVLLLLPEVATWLVVSAAVISAWAIADYAVAAVRSLRRPAGTD